MADNRHSPDYYCIIRPALALFPPEIYSPGREGLKYQCELYFFGGRYELMVSEYFIMHFPGLHLTSTLTNRANNVNLKPGLQQKNCDLSIIIMFG